MPAPKAMSSVISGMSFLRTPDVEVNLSRAVQLMGYLADAHDAAQRYRTAVLHHPDLAEKLRRTFGLSTPANWNGYIPPRTDGHGQYNPSPYRQALVRIVREALDRNDSWTRADHDRLAFVPDSRIEAPWTRAPRTRSTRDEEAALWRA